MHSGNLATMKDEKDSIFGKHGVSRWIFVEIVRTRLIFFSFLASAQYRDALKVLFYFFCLYVSPKVKQIFNNNFECQKYQSTKCFE